MTKRLLHPLLTMIGTFVLSMGAAQAAFPERSVTLVIPYAAGGPTDTFARSLAEVWGKNLKTTIIVENKAGAGTMVGTEAVAKAPADGYTLLLSTVAHAVNPSLHEKLSFDPVDGFAAVGLAARAPLVLVVNNKVPAKTIPEFLRYLEQNKRKVNYSSAGIGSAPHLGGALINYLGGFEAVHVPYRGSAPAMADLIGGHVEFMVDSAPTGLAQVEAGTVRLLGTTMKERLPQTPDTPAVAEYLSGYEAYTWNAVLAPAKTAPDVVETLRASLAQALNDPELQKKAYGMGLLLESDPQPEALRTFIREEIAKWKPVVQSSGMAAN